MAKTKVQLSVATVSRRRTAAQPRPLPPPAMPDPPTDGRLSTADAVELVAAHNRRLAERTRLRRN